jgi:hypothetical protein
MTPIGRRIKGDGLCLTTIDAAGEDFTPGRNCQQIVAVPARGGGSDAVTLG